MGGYPSTTNKYTFITQSDILERLKNFHMPSTPKEVKGNPVTLELRQENFTQNPDDFYAVRWSGGGGFGDPLRRDPKLIEYDLEHLNITPEAAVTIFGAKLDAEGRHVDVEGTAENRQRMCEERLARLGSKGDTPTKLDADVAMNATDNLDIRGTGDDAH